MHLRVKAGTTHIVLYLEEEKFYFEQSIDTDYFVWNGVTKVPFQKLSEDWYYIANASWLGHLSEAPLFVRSEQAPQFFFDKVRAALRACFPNEPKTRAEYLLFFKDDINFLQFPEEASYWYYPDYQLHDWQERSTINPVKFAGL